MWVFTTLGFVSVVQSKTDPDKVVIRSRERRHLENLLREHDLKGTILKDVGTDYEFRMLVPNFRWARAMAEMADRIDYTNFKNAAQANVKDTSPKYVSALHDIWSTLWNAVQPFGRRRA